MPEKRELDLFLNRWVEGPFRLSHHPFCQYFSDHTLTLFGRKICRGCLFWYPGIGIGIIVSFFFGLYKINEYILAILMFCLLIPTLIALPLELPRRFRDIGRGMLGLDTGLAILVTIFPGNPLWYVRVIVLIVFAGIFLPLTSLRNDKNESICQNCPQYSLRSSNSCSGFKILRSRRAIADTQTLFGISDAREENISSFDEI